MQMDFFFYTDVFWLMPLPLKSRVPRDPKHWDDMGSQFSKKCHSRPIHEQISRHLRHCVSSNVAWTPRWDLRVLQLKNQNTGWLLTYKYPIFVPHIWIMIRDHPWSSSSKRSARFEGRQDRAAFVRFGFSSDPSDASDLLSKKACQKGW